MTDKVFNVPLAMNEPVLDYAPGSVERKNISNELGKARGMVKDIPMYIGGEEIRSGKTVDIHPPHDTAHLLGHFHRGDKSHVTLAINAALKAKAAWAEMSFEKRAAIFLKAADLIAGPYRAKL